MAFERMSKEHLELTKVVEKYFGADAGYLDISCLDVARVVLQAGWTKPVPCKDCKHWLEHDGEMFCHCYANLMTDTAADDFCSYGERRDNL
jgi:hypothetical protein